MPTNKKPVLSILVDGDKRDRFADLCSEHGRSMAWAVNAFIDYCIENESINLLDASPTATDPEWLTRLWAMVADIKHGIRRMELSMVQSAVGAANAPVSPTEYLEPNETILEIEDCLEPLIEEEQAQIEQKQRYMAEFTARYGGKSSARNNIF